MAKVKKVLSWELGVSVEEREDCYAATTRPFSITAYGKTDEEAEERALSAIKLLLESHAETYETLVDFLNRMGIKYSEQTEVIERRNTIVRECRREMRSEVLVGA